MLVDIRGPAVIRRESEDEDDKNVFDETVEVEGGDRIQSDGMVEIEILRSRECDRCESEIPLTECIVTDEVVCSDCSTTEDRII